MQIKDMQRSEWKRITAKKQIICGFEQDERHGKISLLRIDDLSEPFIAHYETKDLTLADRGYTWLQLAMENDFAWFTVMFDENDRFLQIYIDVTAANHTECDDPYFEDLYLDFVIDENSVTMLDGDELDHAFRQGVINAVQYEQAINHAKLIDAYICTHQQELIAFFITKQKELKALLDAQD